MPTPDKWLTAAAPTDPVASVAQLALKTRLSAVIRYLPEATRGRDPVEGVHQLRIWSRRSAAALRLFRAFVPRRQRRWFRRTLRKLRRVAGEIRDADVQLARSADGRGAMPRRLRKHICAARRAARHRLDRLARRLTRRGRLKERLETLLAQLARSHTRQTFGSWARAALRAPAAEFFSRGGARAADDEALHALRIAAKRLRYALELGACALPPRFARRLYDELTELQDRLGVICDHRAALDRLYRWARASRRNFGGHKLCRLVEQEIEQLIAARGAFYAWWSPARQARFRKEWNRAVAGRGRRR